MKIFLLSLVTLLITIPIFSQELMFSKRIDLDTSYYKIDAQVIKNELNGENDLFIFGKKVIHGFHISDSTLNKFFEVPKIKGKYKTLLGHSINQDVHHLYYANKKINQFAVKSINVASQSISEVEVDLMWNKEKFLNAFSHNNKFYILTVVKYSSKLKLYDFSNGNQYVCNEIDFSEYTFLRSGAEAISQNLYYALWDTQRSAMSFATNLPKISDDKPMRLRKAASRTKFYCIREKMIITLDINRYNTIFLEVNLDDYSTEYKSYPYGVIEDTEEQNRKSNSYLHHNLLYQLSISKLEMYLSIKNLENNSIIKEYRVKRDDSIYFKNSSITKKNSGYGDGIRELERTNQFLKKIIRGNVGISVYEEDHLYVVIGGYKTVSSGGGGGGMMMTPTAGGVTGSPSTGFTQSVTYTPTYFGGFSSSRSGHTIAFINSVLDKKTFAHIPDYNFPEFNSVNEKIKEFCKHKDRLFKLRTRFTMDDYIIYGYYDLSDLNYYFRKFEKINTSLISQ